MDQNQSSQCSIPWAEIVHFKQTKLWCSKTVEDMHQEEMKSSSSSPIAMKFYDKHVMIMLSYV